MPLTHEYSTAHYISSGELICTVDILVREVILPYRLASGTVGGFKLTPTYQGLRAHDAPREENMTTSPAVNDYSLHISNSTTGLFGTYDLLMGLIRLT